jgi:hypothetical protein
VQARSKGRSGTTGGGGGGRDDDGGSGHVGHAAECAIESTSTSMRTQPRVAAGVVEGLEGAVEAVGAEGVDGGVLLGGGEGAGTDGAEARRSRQRSTETWRNSTQGYIMLEMWNKPAEYNAQSERKGRASSKGREIKGKSR